MYFTVWLVWIIACFKCLSFLLMIHCAKNCSFVQILPAALFIPLFSKLNFFYASFVKRYTCCSHVSKHNNLLPYCTVWAKSYPDRVHIGLYNVHVRLWNSYWVLSNTNSSAQNTKPLSSSCAQSTKPLPPAGQVVDKLSGTTKVVLYIPSCIL